MYHTVKNIYIKRPPEDVFTFITNPANSPRYQFGTEYAEWISDPPFGVGSIWKAGLSFLGRKFEAELQLTEWQPPNQNSYKVIRGSVPLEVNVKVDAQNGGSELIQEIWVELDGVFKLAEGLVGKQLERQIEADLQALKHLLEMSTTGGTTVSKA